MKMSRSDEKGQWSDEKGQQRGAKGQPNSKEGHILPERDIPTLRHF